MPLHSDESTRSLPTGVLGVCTLLITASMLYILLLSISIGDYHAGALMTSIAVVVLAMTAVFIPLRGRPRSYGGLIVTIVLLLAVQSIIAWRVDRVGLLPWWGETEIFFIGLMAVITVIGLIACLLLNRRGWRKSVVGVLTVLAVLQFVDCAYLLTFSDPEIDVWYFHHDAITALSHGQNPYAITYENMHNQDGRDDSPLYARELQRDGRLLFGYMYPPLTLMMVYPSEMLTQDSRYGLTICYLLGCLLVASMSRGEISLCAGAMLMTAPCVWLVFRDAWTEPFLILGLAAVVWLSVRKSPWVPVALGLFLAMKQYTVIFLPLLWLILPRPIARGTSLKFLGIAIGTAAVVSLPLALWNWPAFWHSCIHMQWVQPFRYDSLSFLIWYAKSLPAGAAPPPAAIGFLVLIPVETLLLWKLPRNAAGFSLGVGISMMFFLLLGRQAFLNYHLFAAAALLIAAAAYEAIDASGELNSLSLAK